MPDHQDIFKRFSETFSASPNSLGSIRIRQAEDHSTSPIPLRGSLEGFYSTLWIDNGVQLGGQFDFHIFSLSMLETALYGWRFVTDRSGKTVESPSWKPSWVIFGEQNGDAIFIDMDTDQVYGSIQRRDLIIADSLADFLQSIIVGMKIESEQYHFEVTDDDFNVNDDFLDDVRTAIEKIIGPHTENFMHFFFG